MRNRLQPDASGTKADVFAEDLREVVEAAKASGFQFECDQQTARRLAEALKRRGVAESLLADALAEIQHAT